MIELPRTMKRGRFKGKFMDAMMEDRDIVGVTEEDA